MSREKSRAQAAGGLCRTRAVARSANFRNSRCSPPLAVLAGRLRWLAALAGCLVALTALTGCTDWLRWLAALAGCAGYPYQIYGTTETPIKFMVYN